MRRSSDFWSGRLVKILRCTVAILVISVAGGKTSRCLAGEIVFPFVRGDLNHDGEVTITDLVYFVNYLYFAGPNPVCSDTADLNDDGVIQLADAITMLSLLFSDFPEPLQLSPYPLPGFDSTPDPFGDCGVEIFPGAGAGTEVDHVFFFTADAGWPGRAVKPGQGSLSLPIFVNALFPFEGYTISVRFPEDKVLGATITFQNSVANALNADLTISEVSNVDPGHIFGYVILEFLPPYDASTIPPGQELLLGTLNLTLSPDLTIGETIPLTFEPTDQGLTIGNEIVAAGHIARHPETHDIEIPVVDENSIFLRADVTEDGAVDVSDAIGLLGYLFASQPVTLNCLDAADFNDDGVLDLLDASQMLSYLFAGGASPAPPFPYLGIDSTADSIPCGPT
ncbi:MAG: dockerin type I repeat-containing protein [Planctomycetota bacterium]